MQTYQEKLLHVAAVIAASNPSFNMNQVITQAKSVIEAVNKECYYPVVRTYPMPPLPKGDQDE